MQIMRYSYHELSRKPFNSIQMLILIKNVKLGIILFIQNVINIWDNYHYFFRKNFHILQPEVLKTSWNLCLKLKNKTTIANIYTICWNELKFFISHFIYMNIVSIIYNDNYLRALTQIFSNSSLFLTFMIELIWRNSILRNNFEWKFNSNFNWFGKQFKWRLSKESSDKSSYNWSNTSVFVFWV